MERLRINKFLAAAGICSRRKADALVLEGRVRINDIPITELGTQVSASDRVFLDGKPVILGDEKIYLMLNKPTGVISSSKDQFARRTVLDYVQNISSRLFHVGRLDYDTAGLILLTNDGDMAQRLMHPKHSVEKEYIAVLQGIPNQKKIEVFIAGIEIDGRCTAPAQLKIISSNEAKSTVCIRIHEGRNRQIRKMCEAIGHPVLALKRTAIGQIYLGNLAEGTYRSLTEEEVTYLKGL